VIQVDLSGLRFTITNPAAAKAATAHAPETTARATAAGNTSSEDGSNTSATDSSAISSSDFLTLLVNELKNQDPTQPTDPNAYISQLVDVNSLQQLIEINQGLTSFEKAITG
jgi:flagellar basal-body rod modification protein FlgD